MTEINQTIAEHFQCEDFGVIAISVENAFNGEITEKDGFFGSSKRNGNGIGTQSVRRIAEKDGGYCRFSHENGIFTADVMLHGKN